MEINVDFTPKQSLAYKYLNDNTTTEILFGGSAGGGKSWLGCVWLIISAIQYPGTRWLMGRSKLKALKQTTLNTFFEVCSNFGLNEEHYKYNSINGEITFYNGSTILLKDLFTYPSDPNFDSLGSMEISGAFIDEANQISEKAKNIVSSRIRYKIDKYGLIPKMLMTCNPSKNWVYNEFYNKDKNNELEDYKKFIQALVKDNPNISEHYVKQLEKLDEVSKKRLLFGQWEYEDSSALIKYDNILNLFADYEYIPTGSNYYITCDVARKGKDKAVIFVWNELNIIDKKIMSISLTTDIINNINKFKKQYKVSNRNVVIDGDGVGGGVVDALPGTRDFVNNSKALHRENYQNLKTQCYYKLAEYINDDKINIFGATIEEQEKIIQDLSVIKYKNADKDGKKQIISKDEIKDLIGRSPDYSDAMMMRMIFELKQATPSFVIR